MLLRPFLFQLLIATLLLFVLAALAPVVSGKALPAITWVLIPLYALFSFLLFRMLARASEKSPHRFVSSVNASVLIKLLVTAVIVGIYFFLKMPHRKALALAVMGIYLVYTFVLVRALLPVMRGKKS